MGQQKRRNAVAFRPGNAKAADHSAAHATRKEKMRKEEKRKVMK
jgi:hypothetical protein